MQTFTNIIFCGGYSKHIQHLEITNTYVSSKLVYPMAESYHRHYLTYYYTLKNIQFIYYTTYMDLVIKFETNYAVHK